MPPPQTHSSLRSRSTVPFQVTSRLALDELRTLHRATWRWGAAAFLPLLLLLRLQEPPFFRHEHLPFFWAGVAAAILLFLLLVPLSWSLGRGPESSHWSVRSCSSPLRLVIGSFAGIWLFGCLSSIAVVLISFTLDRLLDGHPATELLLHLELASVLWCAPFAALAPALHHARLNPAASAVLWVVLAALVLGLFGRGFPIPADTVLPALEPSAHPLGLAAVARTALATGGGIALSLAIVRLRLS